VRARLVPSGISIGANTHSSRMVGYTEVIYSWRHSWKWLASFQAGN